MSPVSRALMDQKYEVQRMEATYIPQSTMEISDKDTQELVERCLEDMDNLDDVVKVHCNVVLPQE